MKVEVLEGAVEFFHRAFATPLVLSSGPITEITEARATVRVRVNGREAEGRGAVYLSDLWAWPGGSLSHVEKDRAMRADCEAIAASPSRFFGDEPAHPLEMGLRLHQAVCADTTDQPPLLARLIGASPFDAALHDAVGQALGVSAFDFYDEPAAIPSGDALFPDGGAVAAIRATLRAPVESLDAWLIVGKDDALPGSLAPWIARGYRAFKLKLLGVDNAADVARTVAVFRAARTLGLAAPRLAIDSNCGNPDTASVLDYLERLEGAAPEVYAALEYLEQPTARDIIAHAFDWRPVAKRKPVILDEGLTDFDVLQAAVRQGWSGIALKTCKGHSFTLAAAAWAQRQGMALAMQDLTNPGYAAIHAWLVAAHLPVINGVELNSGQFTPAANADWLPRLEGLFSPTDGCHRLAERAPVGLGSAL